MPSCSANPQTGAEQFRNALVQILIHGPTLVLAGRFSLLDTLGLSLAALLIVLARNGIISTSIELLLPASAR